MLNANQIKCLAYFNFVFFLSSDGEREEERNFVNQEELEDKDRSTTSLSQKINNNSINSNNNINNNNNNNNSIKEGDLPNSKGRYCNKSKLTDINSYHTGLVAIENVNAIDKHRSIIVRNDRHLSPDWRQMPIENTVSSNFCSESVDC